MPRQSQSSKNYTAIEIMKNDVNNIKGDITELKNDQKEGFETVLAKIDLVKEELEEKYARKDVVDGMSKKLFWVSTTFVTTIIAVILSLAKFIITDILK